MIESAVNSSKRNHEEGCPSQRYNKTNIHFSVPVTLSSLFINDDETVQNMQVSHDITFF